MMLSGLMPRRLPAGKGRSHLPPNQHAGHARAYENLNLILGWPGI